MRQLAHENRHLRRQLQHTFPRPRAGPSAKQGARRRRKRRRSRRTFIEGKKPRTPHNHGAHRQGRFQRGLENTVMRGQCWNCQGGRSSATSFRGSWHPRAPPGPRRSHKKYQYIHPVRKRPARVRAGPGGLISWEPGRPRGRRRSPISPKACRITSTTSVAGQAGRSLRPGGTPAGRRWNKPVPTNRAGGDHGPRRGDHGARLLGRWAAGATQPAGSLRSGAVIGPAAGGGLAAGRGT